jgi:hypothetical protein
MKNTALTHIHGLGANASVCGIQHAHTYEGNAEHETVRTAVGVLMCRTWRIFTYRY